VEGEEDQVENEIGIYGGGKGPKQERCGYVLSGSWVE